MTLQHSGAIIIKDKKVLLIKRSEQEDSEPNKWCAPNETLKENELPEDAVVRGVKEELGLKFTITEKLFEHIYKGHTTFIFMGSAEGEIEANPDEVAAYGWFSYHEEKLDFAYDYDKVIKTLHDLNLIN